MKQYLPLIALLPLGLTSLLPLNAQEKAGSEEPTTSQSRRAYIDPITGELSSTPPASEQQRNSANSQQQLELPPVEYTTHPDGTVQGDLNGRFHSNHTATIDCNGSLVTEHSEETPAAEDCPE